MSKYNLSELLTEVAGGRIGTLNISARDLVSKMEDLEDKVIEIDDVSRACFEAAAVRNVCVELPDEDLTEEERTQDLVGHL